MKKSLVIFLALFTVSFSSFAQWSTGTSPNIYYNGTVNIGTSNIYSYSGIVTVFGNSTASPALVAIKQCLAQGEMSDLSLWSTFQSTTDNGPRRTSDIVSGFNGGAWGYEYMAFNVGYNGSANDARALTAEKMRITAGGNVGIGTTDPGAYKLAVNGGIHARSVQVDLTGWPDYVFNPGYKLPSLLSVKNYISQNHHLPDMPDAGDVEKNGLNIGETEKTLTKKLEELTLYMIRLQEENEVLKNRLLLSNSRWCRNLSDCSYY